MLFNNIYKRKYFNAKYSLGKITDDISRVERKTGVSQMVVFPQT